MHTLTSSSSSSPSHLSWPAGFLAGASGSKRSASTQHQTQIPTMKSQSYHTDSQRQAYFVNTFDPVRPCIIRRSLQSTHAINKILTPRIPVRHVGCIDGYFVANRNQWSLGNLIRLPRFHSNLLEVLHCTRAVDINHIPKEALESAACGIFYICSNDIFVLLLIVAYINYLTQKQR